MKPSAGGQRREDRVTVLYLDFHKQEWQHWQKLGGIRNFAKTRDWTVLAIPYAESRRGNIRALLRRHRPAGCIVERTLATESLPPSLFGNTPVVYLDPQEWGGRRGMTTVVNDDGMVARAAFRELSAGLPPSYAIATYIYPRQWARTRVAAFHGLCVAEGRECAMLPERFGEDTGSRAARMAEWVASLPRNCAVFAVNDRTANEVAQAARAVFRPVPRSLTIIGVDDHGSLGNNAATRLSSVKLDFERMGFVAARALGEKMESGDEPGETLAISPLMVMRRESTRGRGRRESYIMEAVEAIRQEACDGLTARELASRFPVSRNHFECRFREAMGRSVLEEILNVRLEHVRAMLARPDMPISAIADFCGFGTERELRKLFAARMGMSPREWRKDHFQ